MKHLMDLTIRLNLYMDKIKIAIKIVWKNIMIKVKHLEEINKVEILILYSFHL